MSYSPQDPADSPTKSDRTALRVLGISGGIVVLLIACCVAIPVGVILIDQLQLWCAVPGLNAAVGCP